VPEQVRNKGGHVMRGMSGVYIILVLALWLLRGICLRMRIIARRRAKRATGQAIEVVAKHGNTCSKVRMELKWHIDIATMVFSSESERDLTETFYRKAIDGQQIVVHVTAKWSEFRRSFPLLITCPDIFC
jgi:hypothetical protein